MKNAELTLFVKNSAQLLASQPGLEFEADSFSPEMFDTVSLRQIFEAIEKLDPLEDLAAEKADVLDKLYMTKFDQTTSAYVGHANPVENRVNESGYALMRKFVADELRCVTVGIAANAPEWRDMHIGKLKSYTREFDPESYRFSFKKFVKKLLGLRL